MKILGRDVIVTIAITIIIIIILSSSNKKQQRKTWHIIGALVFVLAMTVVFSLTGISPISGFHTDIRIEEISYIPVTSTLDMIKDVTDTALVENAPGNEVWLYLCANIAGNILMFGPLGFFLPLLWKCFRKLSKTVLFGFLVSLAIECSQLFLARGTDIDDLILNTSGVMLGYLVFAIFHKLLPMLTGKFSLQDNVQNSAWSILPFVCVIIPFLVIVSFGFYDRAVLFSILMH